VSEAAVLRELEESIAWLEGFPTLLQRTTDGIVRQVNATLSAVPSFLNFLVDDIVAQAEALLARLGELSRQLLDWLAENVWPVIRGPSDLLRVGNDWVTDVYSRVTDVAGQIELSETQLDDYWQGPAASTYLRTVTRQKNAATATTTAIHDTRSALHSLAFTLAALYIAIVAELISLIIGFMVGELEVGTVVGIPVGLLTAIASVVKAIAVGAGLFAAGKELTNGTKEKFTTLLELLNDSQAFDHGAWPIGSADLADASLTDGDRSNWNYKR
jgi:hypothetical protein